MEETLFPNENLKEEVACLFENVECKSQCKICPVELDKNKTGEKPNG